MIRPFNISDTEALTFIIKLNTPQFFAKTEEDEFRKYLNNNIEQYFVIEKESQVVGSGGVNFFLKEHKAFISWDLIHPEFKGQGAGRDLVNYRVVQIKKYHSVKQIIVRTSQLSYGFYEKCGFTLEKTEKDFWAEGFDLYYMTMEL